MLINEDTTPEALSGDAQLTTSDAAGTVGNTANGDNMTLAEINAALGKNFPTKEAAMKSVKDTFSYVGKKIDDIKTEVKQEIGNDNRIDTLAKELQTERIERFYDRNPQYADPSIRKFIESTGKNPAEVVNSKEFVDIFAKVTGFEETQRLKTVLESNPRLNSSRDSLTKAREASKALGGQVNDQIEADVASAVRNAFNI